MERINNSPDVTPQSSQRHEDDRAWGNPTVMTQAQAKSLMAAFRLLEGTEGKTLKDALRVAFAQEIASKFETIEGITSAHALRAKRALEKLQSGLKITAQRRKLEDATFPLTTEELAVLEITSESTPISHLLYTRLNDRFPQKTWASIQEQLTSKKKPAVVEPILTPPAEIQPKQPTSIPYIEPKASQLPAKVPSKQLVLIRALKTTFTEILGTESESLVTSLAEALQTNPDLTPQDLRDLTVMVQNALVGNLPKPGAQEALLAVTTNEKIKYAKQYLGSLLTDIIKNEQSGKENRGILFKMGREINRLLFFLGKRGGRQVLTSALDELPVAVKTLIFRSLSVTQMEQLDYPDLDECTEHRAARYISNSLRPQKIMNPITWKPYYGISEDNLDRLAKLLEACLDRDPNSFKLRIVVAELIQHNPNPHKFFDNMIQAAARGDCVGDLEQLFLSNETTIFYARKCREVMDADDEEANDRSDLLELSSDEY